MKLNWQGQKLDYDSDLTMAQAKAIKRQTGMTIKAWEAGLSEGDPDAMVALVWVILTQNGIPADMNVLDFKVSELESMIEEDEPLPAVDSGDPTQRTTRDRSPDSAQPSLPR